MPQGCRNELSQNPVLATHTPRYAYDAHINTASKGILYASGVVGCLIILAFVFKAYFQRRKMQASLAAARS